VKECPNCASDVPDDATVCRICKYEFGSPGVFPWKPVAAILLVVLLLPLLVVAWRILRR
jgi:hypothetical protein